MSNSTKAKPANYQHVVDFLAANPNRELSHKEIGEATGIDPPKVSWWLSNAMLHEPHRVPHIERVGSRGKFIYTGPKKRQMNGNTEVISFNEPDLEPSKLGDMLDIVAFASDGSPISRDVQGRLWIMAELEIEGL